MRSTFAGALMLVVLTVASPLAVADESPGANARYTIEIGQSRGSKTEAPRVYHVVGAIGAKTQLTYGSRIPIATGGADAQSFSYQNVGLTVNLSTRRGAGGLLEVEANIDGTLIPEPAGAPAGGAPPVLGTFSQSFTAFLSDGKQIRVVELGEPGGARYYVDLRADLLK